MPRPLLALAAGLLLAGTASAQPPAGRWKLKLPLDGQAPVLLLGLDQKGGKWAGEFLGSYPPLDAEPTVAGVTVADGAVRFRLTIDGRDFLDFDGRLGKDGKTVAGSVSVFGGPPRLADLTGSQLRKLADPLDLAREIATQADAGADLFDAGFAVLSQATVKKVPAEEVKAVADKLARASAAHGPRWERSAALRMAVALCDQKGFADLAVAQAKRAERLLGDDNPTPVLIDTAETLSFVFNAAGKPDDAKRYTASAARLEAKDAGEFVKSALGFTPEAAPAGKGRVALVELFTAAEAAPCAAAELAGYAIRQAFAPADVILLTYHLHAGSPDPLCNPDGIDRFQFYADRQKQPPGVPLLLVNGRLGPKVGGPAGSAKGKFGDLKPALDAVTGGPAVCKLSLTVSPGAKGTTAKATVADLKEPGDKTVLRFFLAESRVRYAGDSGVRYHQSVVRSAPGGGKGFPLTKATAEQTVPVDVAAVKAGLAKYLDDFAKGQDRFPRPERPLALADLKLVAVVQNDATGEVLAAAQAEVK
jgi:hypothetical protein